MNKGLQPIPALYACYLLRSTARHGSLYVGSTPDPVRRLKQHNGVSKGGAVRTSKDSLRPWEVTCLVTGFPSKIAALQFEWAWQNTHLTRHLTPESRITQAKSKIRVSPKTGRIRRRTTRPRLSLTDRIANLHLLLQACSFERWPLRVTFYVQDVYKMWQRWLARHPTPLASHITVLLDAVADDEAPYGGLAALPTGYGGSKAHLDKSRGAFTNGATCALCHEASPPNGAGALLCPHTACSMTAHVACLSENFLQAQSSALVPTDGHCPECGKQLRWIDLVRELSLRMRGEAEVAKLFKPVRQSKKKVAQITADEVHHDATDDDSMSQSTIDIDELLSPEPARVTGTRPVFMDPGESHLAIDDSDWDEAEIVA